MWVTFSLVQALLALLRFFLGPVAPPVVLKPAGGLHLVAGTQAIGGVVVAAGVVWTAAWTYRRFRIEGPNMPRCNTALSAHLVPAGDVDLICVDVVVSALGHRTLVLATDRQPAVVAVYDYPNAFIQEQSTPPNWGPWQLKVEPVLVDQETVAAQETLTETHMFPIGTRDSETAAYRVTFGVWVREDKTRYRIWKENQANRKDWQAAKKANKKLDKTDPTRLPGIPKPDRVRGYLTHSWVSTAFVPVTLATPEPPGGREAITWALE